eukprot:Nk52_evm3s913 gene=Nk52_evmTU3s913
MSLAIKEDDFHCENFSASEFIERLSRKYVYKAKEDKESSEFDPQPLLDIFENGIVSLLDLEKKIEDKIKKHEYLATEAEKHYHEQLAKNVDGLSDVFAEFAILDDSIKYLSKRSAHIGEQLDSVYSKRVRALEVQQVMVFFSHFDDPNAELPHIFTDPEQVQKGADAIQKLYFIVQELTSERFSVARDRINERYSVIESVLLDRFQEAYRDDDLDKMTECSETLYTFKGYEKCVEMYINQHRFFFDSFSINQESVNTDSLALFQEIFETCKEEQSIISIVFKDPEHVMTQFVERIFEQYLQNYIETVLNQAMARGKLAYLKTLENLYERTNGLSDQLTDSELGLDPHLTVNLIDGIFCPFLDSYKSIEIEALKDLYDLHSQTFYQSKGHKKSKLPECRGIEKESFLVSQEEIEFVEFINKIDPNETYISIEFGLTLIHDHKEAHSRCCKLSRLSEVGHNTEELFVVLMDYLIVEHITYSLDIASMSLPINDSRVEGMVRRFYEVVHSTNYIFHLLQNHFRLIVLPVISTNYATHASCIQKKNEYMENLEKRLDFGLSQALGWMCIHFKAIFKKYQKKSDFKPSMEDPNAFSNACSVACRQIVLFLTKQKTMINSSLDGKNLEKFLIAMAEKFVEILEEHIRNYTINNIGGMVLTRDISEYQNFFQDLKIPAVKELMERARDIGNIFIVRPENLKEVCNEGYLARMSREKLVAFIQLRSDYRSANIARILPHLV